MIDVVFRKLANFIALPVEDQRLLRAHMHGAQRLPAHSEIIQEGNAPRYLNVIVDGWACRYKQLEDGRRQILALFVPGDMCDPCVFLLDKMSHGLATLTPATILRIPEADVMHIMQSSTALTKALWLEMLVAAEVQREWTASLGRRTSLERMSHLFCELLLRLRAVGLTNGGTCEMPVTQADLGDILGLSTVHINRTLQELRAMRLIDVRGKRLVIHDEAALQRLGLFNADYLHLQRPI